MTERSQSRAGYVDAISQTQPLDFLCSVDILLISSSVSLAASSFSISPKSRVCQSLPAIDERLTLGRHRARMMSYGLLGVGVMATAKSALDVGAKKDATSFNIPPGRRS